MNISLEQIFNISPNFQSLLTDIAIVILILGLSYFVLKIAKNLLFRQLKKITRQTKTDLDDQIIEIINKHIIPIGYFIICYLTFKEVEINETILGLSRTFFSVAITFCTSRFLVDLSRVIIRFYSKKYHYSNSIVEKNINALFPAIRVVIWTLAAIFTISNLGFDIGAIIAGLGIGGVALALASQGILQDLFSYFAILFDRPFEISDLVSVDEFTGYVQHIGIKTTRIKALTGEELVLANTDLTSSRLRNYKRMQSRQAKIKLGIIYETDNHLLPQIPEIIEKALMPLENITFDIAYFSGFGDFSLDYEVIYFVHSNNELKIYRKAQHEVNLAIKFAFAEARIQFAYPTALHYLK
ncbi:mechanosensitive ion channel family protein [Cyanobacterium stanieri LEGE 03274]|uniref:Mechanosensitive ion channel family protein n=1 Tax=Cyanobacterium stanieri LEGE 03274 TaxID=1828756 RepID=A0ABR9V3P7_9CHRO|nr:mechanosensitive ion channel family protein [Cyanobacterium stanieri]MBE9221434.1 mechanosensitive ion channel family protein [Cyanobacterium stanieri LEGE 03274]